MGAMFSRMLELFWTKKLEVVLVGLENSGKTTLLSVLSNGVVSFGLIVSSFCYIYVRRLRLCENCSDY